MEPAAVSPPQRPDSADDSAPTVESSDISSSEEHSHPEVEIAPHMIVRLIQCQHCSKPLRNPCRLPCGNTVCRECLPQARPRTGITYPVAPGRHEGFTCYWEGKRGCVGEHCVVDCGTDIVLCFVAGLFHEEFMRVLSDTDNPDPRHEDERVVCWRPAATPVSKLQSLQIGHRGWLNGIYQFALEGRFPCDAADVYYEEPSGSTSDEAAETPQALSQDDRIRFQKLRDRLRAEVDCQVCYSLILDPMTLPCGHTFCRSCIARVVDHSDLCPICRRKIGMPTSIQSEPTNWVLSKIIDQFFADQVIARREALAQDELGMDHERRLPLFVCTLSFPTMPTFLHIFEPRYRLMIRRVVESGDGKFGMVMYNRRGRPQGDEIGSAPFMQFGTLLMVERYELLPDGRSLVIATGVSRFKVLEAGMLDGYHIARTERVDDISLAEEERLEAMETSTHENPYALPEDEIVEPPLDSMSTQDLMLLTREFIRKQRQSGAPWLHPRVMLAYGPVPIDAARFPWWFASILPIAEEEKYPILSARSVRERLKICARWTKELEARDWSSRSSVNAVFPLSTIVSSLTPNVLTSFTPFSFSISISIGGSPFPSAMRQLNNGDEQQQTNTDDSPATYIPRTLVIGAFLAIFLGQVGINFLQVIRTGRRQRRQAMELQFPQPIPPQPRTQNWETERNTGAQAVPDDGEGTQVADTRPAAG
ncbi:hypothetical protein N7528_007762 [Penicillium herquei]|nr:hypothetical protein N7528_007762 [Penicillium herquei]